MNEKTIKKLRAEHLRQADAIRKLPGYARQTTEFSIEYNMKKSRKKVIEAAAASVAAMVFP